MVEGTLKGRDQALRVAVIGAGRWGPNLIRNFHQGNRSLVRTVVDLSSDRLARVQTRFPEIQVSKDSAAAIDDPDVDAVVIATPARTHAELALQALAAGKHCFIEKPLAPSLPDARAICARAEEAGLVAVVGHVFLYNPAIRRVKRYIDDDSLGSVRYISTIRTNLGPSGMDVNVVWDLASHDISIANYWLGDAPISASAVGGSWIADGQSDTVFATLIYPGQRLLHVNVSWLNPVKTRAITLVGNRQMATIDDMNLEEPVRLYDKGIDFEQDNHFVDSFGAFRSTIRDGDVTIPRIPLGEPLLNECEGFVEAILDGVPPVNSARSALGVVAAAEALDRSIALGGASETVESP